jgi:predicted enzyme related to lactoylglutathione lyase
MTAELAALCFSALDPPRLARFWAGFLGWEALDDTTLLPPDDTGFRLRFLPTAEPKTRPNQMHLDLTSVSLEQQQETVARALSLGGQPYDAGQLPEEEHVVLADPEGNEFCVIEPGNGFLAECGFVGALASDGTQELGHFWSKALGWPLVWDQDEETAVRAPYGGPKITWGGPPVAPKVGPNRLHFDLAATDVQQETERLVSLGATRVGPSPCGPGAVAMLDPDGNELCALAATDR